MNFKSVTEFIEMKTMLTRIFLVLALCCVFSVDGCGRGKSKSETSTVAPTTPSVNDENGTFCLSECKCSDKINVHITIKNTIQPEYFEYNVTLMNTTKQELIRYLEQAAEQDSHFKFSATYFPRMGFFIDSINGLAGQWNPNKTFWEVLNSTYEQINGVSYMPSHEERLIFNFTSSSH